MPILEPQRSGEAPVLPPSTPPVVSTPQRSGLPPVLPSPVPNVPPPVVKEPTALSSTTITDKIASNKDTIKKAADTGLRTDAAGNITYADGTLYKANESVYANPEYTNSPQQDIETVASGAATAGDFGKDARGNVVNMRTGQIVQAAPGTFTGENAETGKDPVLGSTNPKDPNYVLNPNSPAYNPAYFDENPELDPRYKDNFKDLDALKAKGDAFFAREIENIKQQYESLITSQKDTNMRSEASRQQSLLMGGTSRYAPHNEIGILHEEVSFGKQKIADLLAKETAALISAEKAQQEQDYKLADKKLELYKEARTQRDKELTKIYDTIQKTKETQLKNAEEQKKELDEQKNTILKDVGKNNAPPEVINAIANAKNVSDMVKAAGEWLQAGSGTVGEYTAYKRDAETRGLVPISFDEYQARDANRKIAIAKASATGNDLSTTQLATFLRISDKFQANPVIKAAKAAAQSKQVADMVIADPKNAGNQLIILYTLIRSLDPESAVKSDEVNLAQRTQSYLSKFKTELERLDQGKVISDQAAVDLAKATKVLASQWEEAGVRQEKDFVSQAKTAGVEKAFGDYLTGSSRTYQNSTSDTLLSEGETAKKTVDTYIDIHPDMADNIAAFYDIPGMDDAKVAKWIANQNK